MPAERMEHATYRTVGCPQVRDGTGGTILLRERNTASKVEMAHTATVVDIQRFSLHDGPGIRTTVFFKGCVLRCAWCQNPESLRPAPEMAYYRERCASEWRCAAVCPRGAILADPHQRVDFANCDACGRCVEACGHDALRLVGRRFDVATLAREILKDRDFFRDSGGGVTLSGGEPMMQAAFLQRLLPLLAAEDLHVTMQTCGMFPWARMEPLLPHLDLVQFDLKHMDSAAHERLTGAGNAPILDNFARLARSGVRLEARMPMIPGLNDDPENIRAVARFLARHGHSTLRCLPYHDLGEAKLPRLAPILAPLGRASLLPPALEPIARRFGEEGIDVTLEP
jgi:pyruvate formate lyase activating enzyme